MDSFLQEITMLPGVLGCFIYTSKQGLAAAKLPPIFKASAVKTIGSLLTRTLQMGSAVSLPLNGMEIKFNESLIMVRSLTGGNILTIICDPGVNKSLLNMTTGMLTADIETALKNIPAAGTQAAAATPAAVQAPQTPQPQAPPKEAEIDESLAPILEEVKDSLALAIGPIAGPIMKDIIEQWAQSGPASKERLGELAVLLRTEINDPDLEKEFMDGIGHHLP
ncbi:MAG: hypothetical protein ABFS19_05385 [Thermodesulfobacteriota bacterium]